MPAEHYFLTLHTRSEPLMNILRGCQLHSEETERVVLKLA